MKRAISAGIGLFLGIIAMENAGIVVDSPATLVTAGDFSSAPVILALIGFALISALNAIGLVGGTIIGILVVTVLGVPFGQLGVLFGQLGGQRILLRDAGVLCSQRTIRLGRTRSPA